MTTEKITFLQVLRKYIIYSEAFSQYTQLETEDKKIVKPYIDSLKRQWEEELKHVSLVCNIPAIGKRVL